MTRIYCQKHGTETYSKNSRVCSFESSNHDIFAIYSDNRHHAQINNKIGYKIRSQFGMKKVGEILYFSGSGEKEFTP